MAVALRETPEELKKVASDITSEVATIKSCLKNIDQEVLGTQKYWRGDASTQHISKYNEIKPGADAVVEKLELAPRDLLQIAGLYEETEDMNSQVAMSLPVDIFA